MNTVDTILQIIPAKYAPWLALLPLVGRSYHALKNGGGLRGMWQAIWLGKTTPETKPADKSADVAPPTA